MLACNDMFQVKGLERIAAFWQAAIFTDSPSAKSNEFTRLGIHRSSSRLRENSAGFGLQEGDQVAVFDELLVLTVFIGRKGP